MRCWETTRNRLRCKLTDGHEGPCDFQGEERRRRDRERQRARRKPCPTCLKVHPGPRCIPEDKKRVKLSLYLDPELLDELDEVSGYGPGEDRRYRREAVEEAIRDWLRGRQ